MQCGWCLTCVQRKAERVSGRLASTGVLGVEHERMLPPSLPHSIPAPSVPYMGPYLNQLITIEVGMHTFVKDPPEHVNFSKLERVREKKLLRSSDYRTM